MRKYLLYFLYLHVFLVWGPPVNDYSARIWSGLIRDYYLPRWLHYFESKKTKQSFNFDDWERKWVEESRKLSPVVPFENPIEACLQFLKEF
ncbi:MAG: alpha-N-acetylglucosaminidase C-terminal domain-containing protein [Capnocytophaga felis]|nr:alpha-N-acetylglucosaminidase C-terminal domain-containing protein [Capnocytophaga felis]